MNATFDVPLQRILELHEEVGASLRKRYLERQSLAPETFPATDDEKAVWDRFTAPENLDALTEMFRIMPPSNTNSIALWKKAIADCQARAAAVENPFAAVQY